MRSLRGRRGISMCAILLPAPRHGESSRGTPRLRRLLRTLQGALRLAAGTTTLNSQFLQLADAHEARSGLISSHSHPTTATPTWSEMLLLVAASGGFLVRLDWTALTPAPTEIRLLTPVCCMTYSCHRLAPSGKQRLGRLVAVQSTPIGALPAGARTGRLLMPNVRVKPAPTV